MSDSVSPIPPPTEADLKRQAGEDLAACDAATPPPWEIRPEGGWGEGVSASARCVARPRPDLADKYPPATYGEAFREEQVCSAWAAAAENLKFIAMAREALPAWIRRAAVAEAERNEWRRQAGERLRQEWDEDNKMVRLANELLEKERRQTNEIANLKADNAALRNQLRRMTGRLTELEEDI